MEGELYHGRVPFRDNSALEVRISSKPQHQRQHEPRDSIGCHFATGSPEVLSEALLLWSLSRVTWPPKPVVARACKISYSWLS